MNLFFKIVDLHYNSGGISRYTTSVINALNKKFNIEILEFSKSKNFLKIKKKSCNQSKIKFLFFAYFEQIKSIFIKKIYVYNHLFIIFII
jgi:hypothetical protein